MIKLSLTILSLTAITLEKSIKPLMAPNRKNLNRSKRGHKTKVKYGGPPSGGGNKLKMEFSKCSIAALVSDLASQAGDSEGTNPNSDTESKDGEDKKMRRDGSPIAPIRS